MPTTPSTRAVKIARDSIVALRSVDCGNVNYPVGDVDKLISATETLLNAAVTRPVKRRKRTEIENEALDALELLAEKFSAVDELATMIEGHEAQFRDAADLRTELVATILDDLERFSAISALATELGNLS